MKLYYEDEEEFLADYNEADFKQPEYSEIEQRKRHNAIMNSAMRAKWASSMMLTCPHPDVKQKYGTDRLCVWICRSCRFAQTYPQHGGVTCTYKQKEARR